MRLFCVFLLQILMALPLRGQESSADKPRLDVQSYTIELELVPENSYLKGQVTAVFTLLEDSPVLPFELNNRLSLIEVQDAEGVPYTPGFDSFNSSRMLVRGSQPFHSGTQYQLTFRFDGTLESQEYAYLDNSARSETAVIGPDGALLLTEGKWFPSHLLALDPASVELRVTVPLGFTVVAPGELQPIETVGINEVFDWKSDRPLTRVPLLVSRYFRQQFDQEPVPVTFYVNEDFDRDLEPVAGEIEEMVRFFEQQYGGVRPFQSLNLVQVGNVKLPSSGASGLILLESTLWDSGQLPEVELARRIARQWWSASLYIRGGYDAWLQDGFADYAVLQYLREKHGDRFKAELAKMAVEALTYEQRAPITKGLELGRGSPEYESVVGAKGAWTLYMLGQLLGFDRFDDLLVQWYRQNAGKAVTTDQFVEFVNAATGQDYRWFFLQWVESTGVPEFRLDYTILKLRQGGFKIRGQIQQDLELFQMPLELTIETKGKPEKKKLRVSGKSTSFVFKTETLPVRIKLDPEGKILRDSDQMRVAVHIALGEEYQAQREYVSAIREFEKAKALDPRSSYAHYRLGDTFFQQHSYESAANSFRDALDGDLKPEWVETWTHIQLGKIYDILGLRQRALAEYQKAINSGIDYNDAQAEAKKYKKDPYTKPRSVIN
ncbi:MAG: M1 family aminopeptidase [Acidobacteriota bacterium]